MAKENITKFFDAAMTDKALSGKVAALAAEHGYDFTAAEFLELGAARPLSDEDAGDASGGGYLHGESYTPTINIDDWINVQTKKEQ